MITQEVKNTLYQFKRVHTNQIKPHIQVLPPELESQIKRKNLRLLSDKEVQKLAHRVLKTINQFQKNRSKPHTGLIQFSDTLINLLDS